MDFGLWDIVFIVGLTIFCLYRDFKRRFQVKENEIDKVLAEAEQVKYRNMVKEVMFCKSEIVEGQILFMKAPQMHSSHNSLTLKACLNIS